MRSFSSRLSLLVSSVIWGAALAVSAGIAIGVFSIVRYLASDETLASQLPIIVLGVCDLLLGAFLFFIALGLLTQLQRSELIDFRKMLYLPISLRTVFLLNFFDSLFSPALLFFVLPVAGLILALVTAGHGPALLGIPLAATFYFMWGAWLYCVRGVLVALMENKRRRRLVVAIATLTFVLIAQLPNLVGRLHIKHILGRRRAERVTQIEDVTSKDPNAAPRKRAAAPEDIDSYDPSKEEIQEEIERWKFAVIVANIVVPLGWFSYGMYALLADSAGEAVLCILASGLFGALGISIGYRSTWRYYMGISSGRKRKRAAAKPRAAPAEKGFLMNRSVPFVADDTSAAAVAAFLTYVRHPHVRLMLIMPIVFGALFFGLYLGKVANLESVVARNLLMAAVVVWPMMNTGMLALNLFGVDRRGFGTYILLPSKRHTYLLAKNLALLPIACAPSFLFVTIVSVFVRPSITVLAIALIQVLQLYLIFCIAGNLFSCWLPWRMQWDAMRASKHTWTTGLHGLLIFFLAPLLAIPTAACLTLDPLLTWALGYRGIPVGPVVAVGLLVSTAFVYRASLDRAGRVLMRREKIIYDKVREEDE